jgi:hypothetical protein
MAGFGLKEKQKVAVLLSLLVVRKGAFFDFSCIFKMAGNFFSLV